MKRSWQIYNRTHLRTKDKYELKVITDLVCLRSRTLFYSITFFFLSFVCLFFIDSSEIPSVVALLSFDLIKWFIKQSSLKSFKEEVYLAPNINTTGRLLIYSPCLCFLHSDAIVSQVLDELGLNLSDELSSKKKKTLLRFFLWLSGYFLLTPRVYFRLAEHWRKPVGGRSEEGGASGDPGRRRRRPGGASE